MLLPSSPATVDRTEKRSKAFHMQKGARAFHNGKLLDDCHHRVSSTACAWWMEGYVLARINDVLSEAERA